MIRPLVKADNEVVFSYLTKNPALNLFIIGDIEAFGYDQEFQELWGEFSKDGSVTAVLLRYHNTFIISAEGSYNTVGFAEIIRSYDFAGFSGSEDAVTQLEALLPLEGFRKTDSYFAECTTAEHATLSTSTEKIHVATVEDIGRIMDIRGAIPEFHYTADAEKTLRQALEAKTGRTYYIEEDGEIISLASTTAENSLSGMVVGVGTREKARKKGYVTYILERVIRDLLAEEKTLCLFYNNPHAGRIYKRLGFEDIGRWRMYRK